MVGFLSLSCSLGEVARATEVHVSELRREVEFGPNGLARDGAEFDAPAVGECLDEEETAPRLGVVGGRSAVREVVTACVRHLDSESCGAHQECEAEIASGEAAVRGGVRGQFGDEVFGGLGGVVGQVPGAQPLGGEEPGEAGTAWRGGQQDAEVTGRGVELGGDSLVHVTERGGACLP